MIVKTFVDNAHGNKAKICEVMMYPYKGANKKVTMYKLSLYAAYNYNMLYLAACYDTMAALIKNMEKYGNWEEV